MFFSPSGLREYRRYRRNRQNRRLTIGLLLALILAIALGTHPAAPARHRPPECTTAPAASGTTRQAGGRDGRAAGHPAGPRHARDARQQACGLPPARQDKR